MAAEYKGKEIIYAVAIPPEGEGTETIVRPFNQTSGESTTETATMDLSSKDKSSVDYSGEIVRNVSLEGVLTEDDTAVDYLQTAQESFEQVKIYEINTRTKEAKWGMYVISSFSKSSGNGEFATYSLEAQLASDLTATTLVTVPAGA